MGRHWTYIPSKSRGIGSQWCWRWLAKLLHKCCCTVPRTPFALGLLVEIRIEKKITCTAPYIGRLASPGWSKNPIFAYIQLSGRTTPWCKLWKCNLGRNYILPFQERWCCGAWRRNPCSQSFLRFARKRLSADWGCCWSGKSWDHGWISWMHRTCWDEPKWLLLPGQVRENNWAGWLNKIPLVHVKTLFSKDFSLANSPLFEILLWWIWQ